MASIQASAFSKDYVSYCNCARMGRSKECCCAEEQEEFDWFWDPFSTQSDSIIQVCSKMFYFILKKTYLS